MAARFSVKGLETFLNFCDPEKSVLLRGVHGIGKSQILQQFANRKNLIFCDIRLGQTELGDLMGLPRHEEITTPGGKVIRTSYSQPWWWPDLNLLGDKKGWLILFDEFNRGREDVQQAAFQIVLDRGLYGRYFPKQPPVYVMAAINHMSDVYQVSDMDPALLDRFFVADFAPTHKEWLDWSKDKLRPELRKFLAEKEFSHFIDPDPAKMTDPNKKQPSRRSWMALSKCLDIGHKLEPDCDSGVTTSLTNDFHLEVMQGFVGIEAARAFWTWFPNQDEFENNRLKNEEATPEKIFDSDGVDPKLAGQIWNSNQIQGFCDKLEKYWQNKNFTQKKAEKLWGLYSSLTSDEYRKKIMVVMQRVKSDKNWEKFFKAGSYETL